MVQNYPLRHQLTPPRRGKFTNRLTLCRPSPASASEQSINQEIARTLDELCPTKWHEELLIPPQKLHYRLTIELMRLKHRFPPCALFVVLLTETWWTLNRDSFEHFFYSCPFSCNLLLQWSRALEPAPDIDSEDFRYLYWYGTGNLTTDVSGTVCLAMDTFKYVLWKAKLRKRLPNITSVKRESEFLISLICLQSKKTGFRFRNTNLIANYFQVRG